MPRFRRSEHAIYHSIQPSGGVVLHVDTGAYHRVNQVGAVIWELLEAGSSRAEIAAELRSRIVDAPDCLEADVDEFLEALEKRELVVRDSEDLEAGQP